MGGNFSFGVMISDFSTVMERLDSIESRLRRIEEEVVKGRGEGRDLRSTREAVEVFLGLSKGLEDRWKGSESSVQEVRKMRKRGRGY